MDIPTYLEQEKGITLSEQQQQGVAALEGVILLLAVPGAGKTTVLTARTANLLVNKGLEPERLLTLTFSRESAGDMERRWQGLFGGLNLPKPTFATIHGFCYSLLLEYAALRNSHLPRLLEGEGDGAKGRILRDIYHRRTGDFLTDDLLSDLMNALSYGMNMRLSPEDTFRLDRKIKDFSGILKEYTAFKRENQLMDFDDMLLFAYTALERSSALRARMEERYAYIQVDEAQDTSRLQQDILGLLCGGNLFMVGDEDQSIYGFRGAWPQGLMEFFQRWPGGRILKLETNRRSTGAIVERAAQLIEYNRHRHPKAMVTPRSYGEKPVLHTTLDMEEEYEAIVNSLEKLESGESCAVLYRTTHSGLLLAALLRQRGIPFFCRQSRLGWEGDMIVRDITGLMMWASGGLVDKELFSRLYFKVGCSIPRTVAQTAREHARGDILKWLMDEMEWPNKNTGQLAYVRRLLCGMRGKHPLKQVETILFKLEYLYFLEKKGAGGYPLNAYFQKLAVVRGCARYCATVRKFLEALPRLEEEMVSSQATSIILSTVHSAKGQEFDRVIIADALDGIFPVAEAIEAKALEEDALMEEETRLFYTAVTRAKDTLEVYAPASGFGRRLEKSRFLRMMAGDDTSVAVAGQQVSHAYFGMGRITAVNIEREIFTVTFKHAGTKTFALKSLEDSRIFQIL